MREMPRKKLAVWNRLCYNKLMNMKKLLQWKYMFPTLALICVVAFIALSGMAETGPAAEPTATPASWGELPEETPEPTPEPKWAPRPAQDAAETDRRESLYEAVLSVSRDRHPTVAGKLRLTYVNTSNDTLYAVKLRLHANDVAPGSFALGEVAVNSERAFYTLSGENESILAVALPLEITPGQSAEIYLSFTASLPETGNRFGINETGIMLGNFLPIAAVYENGIWRTDVYDGGGDPFYSDVADYRIAITYPKTYTLAATGAVAEEDENYYERTCYITAPRVRYARWNPPLGARSCTVWAHRKAPLGSVRKRASTRWIFSTKRSAFILIRTCTSCPSTRGAAWNTPGSSWCPHATCARTTRMLGS